jgi:hypothetical protein
MRETCISKRAVIASMNYRNQRLLQALTLQTQTAACRMSAVRETVQMLTLGSNCPALRHGTHMSVTTTSTDSLRPTIQLCNRSQILIRLKRSALRNKRELPMWASSCQ